MEANLTISEVPPQWNSEPMFHLPPLVEPLVGIIVFMMWVIPANCSSRSSYLYWAVLCSSHGGGTFTYLASEKKATTTPILTLTRRDPQTTSSGMIQRMTTTRRIRNHPPDSYPSAADVWE